MALTATERPAVAPLTTSDSPPVKNLLVIMIGVLLGVLLGALDQTIVGPALPKIIGDLNGFEHYTWVVTAYLLTSTISVPLFGKLGDMYGRKWFFVGGILTFLVGSALCGQAQDIWQLIVFRGLQGLGGGIMFSNAFTIIADLVPPAERGRWQGLFGAVWGLASVFGPTAGGYLTDNLSWRWVFYVNLPVGLLALVVLLTTFPNMRPASQGKRAIDWAGALTLVASMTPLLLALSLGGTKDWAWDSVNTLSMFAVAVVFLAIFLFVESRAKEPILPLDLFKSSIFSLSIVTVFLSGLGMFGALIFIPLFVQAVQGASATSSGNVVTPMMLAVVASSIITGQLVSRTGRYRLVGIGGMILLTVGMFLLATMTATTDSLTTVIYMIVLGLGLGVAMPLYNLIVQNAFPITRVGVVTAAVQFFRSIGGTVGAAVLGSVVTNRFQSEFGMQLAKSSPQIAARMPAGFASQLNPQALISPEAHDKIGQAIAANGVPAAAVKPIVDSILAAMKPALAVATTEAFLIGASALVIAVIATAFIKEIPLRKTNARPALDLAEGVNPEAVEESAIPVPSPATNGAKLGATAAAVQRVAAPRTGKDREFAGKR